jgi:hypothetical protein
LNQIEIVFGIVIRRASFKSTDELKQRLLDFIDYFNRTFAQPFRWTYTVRPVANTTVNGEHRTYLDDFVSGSARFSSAAFEAPSTAPFVKFAASSAAPSMASPV